MSRVTATQSMIIQGNEPTHTAFSPKVILTICAMICASTGSILSFKMQGDKYNFKHGMFQVVLMFIGEYGNLLLYFGIFVSLVLFLGNR